MAGVCQMDLCQQCHIPERTRDEERPLLLTQTTICCSFIYLSPNTKHQWASDSEQTIRSLQSALNQLDMTRTSFGTPGRFHNFLIRNAERQCGVKAVDTLKENWQPSTTLDQISCRPQVNMCTCYIQGSSAWGWTILLENYVLHFVTQLWPKICKIYVKTCFLIGDSVLWLLVVVSWTTLTKFC